MGCPTTPLSCLEPANIFAGIYNQNCGGFADPSRLQAERTLFSSVMSEMINNYGVDLNYYINGFDLNKANILYGEHPTQEFSTPFIIRSYIELTEGVTLSNFGYDSEDELIVYIHIKTFESTFITFLLSEEGKKILIESGVPLIIDNINTAFFTSRGLRIEPKSGDLLEITSFGCDRPGDRGAKIFQITEVLDQDIANGLNPMGGHYVWRLKATRYDHTHETNAPRERGDDQVYDNTFSGKLSSSLFPTLSTQEKVYPFNMDTISKEQVYDMDNTNNDLYGDYY